MGYATLNGAPGSTPPRAKGFGTQLQRDRFVCTPYFPQSIGKVLQRLRDLWWDTPAPALESPRFDGTAVPLSPAALGPRAAGPDSRYSTPRPDGRGPTVSLGWPEPAQQGLRLGILAVHAMDNPQVVERGGDIGVKLAMRGLANFQPLEIHRFRFHILILPLAGIDLRQL